ncbi:Putative DNA repair helicase RadD [archaeon HR04]|jgi:type I restriction enzyme R subunit|nr:Putative DNA repair helicase RadD [archaeon HR04]
MLNEADTRAKLIDPKLHESGWCEEFIRRDMPITFGRLIDEQGNRKAGKKPDYILLHSSGCPIAVVEAKDEAHSALDGIQQAKSYAMDLDVLFAYSTNGHGIEEFDFSTNLQRSLDRFPSPDELWQRYTAYKLKGAGVRPVNPLEVQYYYLPGGRKPRYFQEVAIKRVIEEILKGKRRLLLTMATGTGKTFVAFQIVWKLVKSGYFKRVLYLADRLFLRDQAYNEFSAFGYARAIIEEGKAPPTRDIYFSIYQSMYSGEEGNRLYQQYSPDFFDLIIIDECHRSGYGTWKQILDYFSSAVHLGMTATPKRDDNIDTYAYFGEPVYSYSMGRAIEDGFLAPFQIFRAFTNIDRHGLRIKDALYQGAQFYIPEEADLKEIYTLEDFEREIVLPDRTARICEHLANLLRTFGPKQKTMVFCVNMEHAAMVAKELQNHFAYLSYPDYAVRIVSEEPEVRELYERFRDSDKPTPVVATTVDLLTTGVDVPSVHNIVLIKPIASKVVFKQIIGRGSRIDPNTNKYFFRIIDYVNATRLLDDWDYPEMVEPSKMIEGPFDISISGLVVNAESQTPLDNVKVVAQIGPNMQRNTRTGNDGRFTLTDLPHSSITLHITETGFRSKQMTITPSPGLYLVIELKPEASVEKKIVLKGIQVYIAQETRIVFTSDGRTLSEAEYIEYSRNGVVQRAASLKDLREIWSSTDKRNKFLQALYGQSIFPNLIASLLKHPDADAFDILAHIAFDVPIFTREERVSAFKNLHGDFLNTFDPQCQQVLLALLDKYRVGGIEEISKPEVFRIPPFDKMGFLGGVAKLFGGIENLRNALDALQKGLYSG